MSDIIRKPFLLAIDGETHTERAVEWALEMAGELRIGVVALHVKDPYLKQFSNEIYAQGREEYLDHVQDCLDEVAHKACGEFEDAAKSAGIDWNIKTISGEPLDELKRELAGGDYGAVVLGKKIKTGISSRIVSDLPGSLLRASVKVPILVIPQVAE